MCALPPAECVPERASVKSSIRVSPWASMAGGKVAMNWELAIAIRSVRTAQTST